MTSTNAFQREKLLAYGRQAEIFAWGEGRVLKLFLGNWPEAARHGKISIGLLVLSRVLRGIFRSAYVRGYFRHSPYSEADLLPWEIILAAQRIGDRIPGEEGKLIRFIERNLSNI